MKERLTLCHGNYCPRKEQCAIWAGNYQDAIGDRLINFKQYGAKNGACEKFKRIQVKGKK